MLNFKLIEKLNVENNVFYTKCLYVVIIARHFPQEAEWKRSQKQKFELTIEPR